MKTIYLVLVSLLIGRGLWGQDSTALQQYLQQHSWPVREQASVPFSFDTSFPRQQLFLMGEVHGYEKAHTLDFLMLQYLHARAGVRHYVMEIDAAQAWCFNRYLQNGDEKLLDTVFNYWVRAGLQWGNKALYRKLQNIRQWNLSLPLSDRITILGIDKIQQLPLALQYFNTLLQRHKGWEKRLPAATTVSGELLAAIDRQQHWLGDDYPALRYLAQNLRAHFLKTGREQQLTDNFITLYHNFRLDQHKAYGFLGFFHTIQDRVNDTYAFAGRLQQSIPTLKDHIISMNLVYTESDFMLDATMNPIPFPPFIPKEKLRMIPNRSGTRQYLQTDIFSQDGMLMKVKGSQMLKAITSPNSITVFDMRQARPFVKGYSSFMDTEIPLPRGFSVTMNDPAALHFQYLILIRHSGWAEPFLEK